MNTLLLAAMAAISTPSEADMGSMFDKSDAFVRVCQPALAAIDDPDQPDEQAAAGLMCVSFATGVGYAKHTADNYTVRGEPICSGGATPRQALTAAFRVYSEKPAAKKLTPTELVLAGMMDASPCP